MPVHTNKMSEAALPLAEIALNAAIELDNYHTGPKSSKWLKKLADAIKGDETLDVGLFPIYDRALTSSEGTRIATKADLHAKLREISQRLVATDDSSGPAIALLRDFCIALHDALLSQGYLSHYKTVSNSRLHA